MNSLHSRPSFFHSLTLNMLSFAIVASTGLLAAFTTSTANPSAAFWPTQAMALGLTFTFGPWSIPGAVLGAMPAAWYQTGTASGLVSITGGFLIVVISALGLLHFARTKNAHKTLGEYFLPSAMLSWMIVSQVLSILPLMVILAWTGNLKPSFFYERMFSWIFAGALGFLLLFPFFVAHKHALRRLVWRHPFARHLPSRQVFFHSAVTLGSLAAILALSAWNHTVSLLVFPAFFLLYAHCGARTLATGTVYFAILVMFFDANGIHALDLPDASEGRLLKQFFLLTVGAQAAFLPLLFRGARGRHSARMLAIVSLITWPLFVVFHLYEHERTEVRFHWYASLAEQEIESSPTVNPNALLGRENFLQLVPFQTMAQIAAETSAPFSLFEFSRDSEARNLVRRVEVKQQLKNLTPGSYNIVPQHGFHGEQPHRSLWSGFSSVFLLFALGGVFANRTHARAKVEQIAERRLRLLERHRALSLEQARLVSLGEMAGSIAHEINNPLAIICGRSQQLLLQFASQDVNLEDAARQVSSIDRTAERIARIVEGLRRFSRNAENAPLEKERLVGLVEQILEFTREKFLLAGIEVQIRIPPHLSVSCRGVQIGQVFHNLLSNSYDALTGAPEQQANASNKGWVRVDAEQMENGFVEIAVTDSGSGIPPAVVAHMMEPFFTTKAPGQGTGLGLAISRRIVQAHGGSLVFDAKAPSTRFVFTLPAADSTLPDGKA